MLFWRLDSQVTGRIAVVAREKAEHLRHDRCQLQRNEQGMGIQPVLWTGRGVHSTAVFNAFVNMSKPSSPDSSDATFDEDELTRSPTYINLYSSVYEAYKEHDPFYHIHGISFLAQDDKWDSEWRRRSGFPLVDYE